MPMLLKLIAIALFYEPTKAMHMAIASCMLLTIPPYVSNSLCLLISCQINGVFILIFSHFLYSVSHPGKNGTPSFDLSDDDEAKINTEGLTDHQILVERVIRKVFFKYSILLDITDKVRGAFKSKLWRMGQTLSKLGGTKRQTVINQWKETVWPFAVNVSELNEQLLLRKRQLENKLESEVAKRQKMETNSASLLKEVKQLRKVSTNQARTIVSLKAGRSENSHTSSSKNWSSYSRMQQSRKRKRLLDDVKAALSVCDSSHFVPVSVDMENVESGQGEKIDLRKGTFATQHQSKKFTDEDVAHFALYVKDQFTLSDAAYREISQLTPDLPRLLKLKQLSQGLNSNFEIEASPNGFTGVQQSFKTRLLYRLQQLKLNSGETIQVKLTGDGTNIAKHLHVVNFAFTLINEGSLALSPFGNHSLAILQVPEDYSSLLGSLSDIVGEVSELTSVTINESEHQIEYFVGGDMKFLAIVCGIDAANSNFSCVWCKCPSVDRWDMSKQWSAFDSEKGARTISEIEEYCKRPKAKRFGCHSNPIFKCVPIDHHIIDSLHLFLRVSDVLINLLIQDLRREDGIARATVFDRTKHSNVTAYEDFLNNVCKIHFKWYTSHETKQMQWRDLTGPEKIRLFNKVDIPKYFPALSNGSAIQDIWIEFWRLFNKLSMPEIDTLELQSDIKNWVGMFLKVYQTKNVTPYIHSFAHHVPEFVDKYGGIVKFTQQGLEKLNDLTTQHFLRASNHRTTEALKQVLEKRNRLEQLSDEGFKRTVRLVHCSICGETSHNKRKCPSRPPLVSLDNSINSGQNSNV